MLEPIPDAPYHAFKNYLRRHRWTHYFVHMSYCLLLDNINGNYKAYSPKEWIVFHGRIENALRP